MFRMNSMMTFCHQNSSYLHSLGTSEDLALRYLDVSLDWDMSHEQTYSFWTFSSKIWVANYQPLHRDHGRWLFLPHDHGEDEPDRGLGE